MNTDGLMKKIVKVKEHTREGSIIPEHDRVIESDGESLQHQLKRKADDKAKRAALFGENNNDST